MAVDSFSDKAYVARPCQFVMSAKCETKVWTDLRYSRGAVDSLNTALDRLKAKGNYKSLELVGFSGGATLALLVGSQRHDIQSIRTVAGNLAPHFVNQFHKVSPMPLALDPADRNKELAGIPQLHFYGENDSVITPQVLESYKRRFRTTECIYGMKVIDASHQKGWAEKWPYLLKQPLPACQAEKS
ncbi:hypothetical protein M3P05_07055 [Sansalvadorimonas sp. 2012CJ34-2]|uniref:Serine hydrolase domain-containing protein n=1 Tax=Parendozoicomonas callyspongiae TaxID=2942213 RepID=A0ABT0PFB5_9GAMM|nr:hypothetical protein [Sansalvadorimonas sp. 2012CJ34-2]MCL6269696.1 hypothetical protein [Sansalvadorimonas sp. 2012CJ34-2]